MIETIRRYAGLMPRLSWVSASIILLAMAAPAWAQDNDLPRVDEITVICYAAIQASYVEMLGEADEGRDPS